MSFTTVLSAVGIVLSVCALALSYYTFEKQQRGSYDSVAAGMNLNFATESELLETVLKVRSHPDEASEAELTRYNVWMLGVLQYYDSDHSRLVDSSGNLKLENGYCALVKSALGGEGGDRFWSSHSHLFEEEFQTIVNRIRSSNLEPVVWADLKDDT